MRIYDNSFNSSLVIIWEHRDMVYYAAVTSCFGIPSQVNILSPWLKEYIDMNTQFWKEATNKLLQIYNKLSPAQISLIQP